MCFLLILYKFKLCVNGVVFFFVLKDVQHWYFYLNNESHVLDAKKTTKTLFNKSCTIEILWSQ